MEADLYDHHETVAGEDPDVALRAWLQDTDLYDCCSLPAIPARVEDHFET